MKAFKHGDLISDSLNPHGDTDHYFFTSYTSSLMDFVGGCWPSVMERNGCYLLSDVNTLNLTEMMHIMGDSRASVETQLNRRKLVEMLPANGPASPKELIALGKMIQEMWQAKLKQEFPNKVFTVLFTQGKWGDDVENFELTFFQNTFSNQ